MSSSPPSDITMYNFNEVTCFHTVLVQNPSITIDRNAYTTNTTGVSIENSVQNAWENQ